VREGKRKESEGKRGEVREGKEREGRGGDMCDITESSLMRPWFKQYLFSSKK
jgi:hypothetical protein